MLDFLECESGIVGCGCQMVDLCRLDEVMLVI